MAWTDKPTDAQIRALLNMMRWVVADREVAGIVTYLENNATRRQVSDELGRLRDLKIDRKLTRESCFSSDLWKGFEHEDARPSEEQIALVYAILRRPISIVSAALASGWLKENATMKQVATEIDRLKDLEKRNVLDDEECFSSEIWAEYEH